MIPPPKRYEDDNDPRYDSIRYLPWFHTLEERRLKIPVLRAAEKHLKDGGKVEDLGIDPREFRDYLDFVSGRSKFAELKPESTKRAYQKILDYAYDYYVASGGAKPISKIIYDESQLFGVNARHVVELWEIDASFLPTQYRQT
jgi:hypothetical protein